MNIAYFRKSSFDLDKTVENVKKEAESLGLKVLGETGLNSGKVIHVCNPAWLGNLVAADYNLIGLLPCSVVVLDKSDTVMVGVGSPSVLGSVSGHPAIAQLASQADDKLKDLINKSAGAKPLEVSNIKLYSTMTCPYCKMEKSWLESKNVKHEVIYVDLNPQEAENLVAKTGQMGVPVTEVQYEEGEPEYIIGFDQTRLASILNIK